MGFEIFAARDVSGNRARGGDHYATRVLGFSGSSRGAVQRVLNPKP